jgi:Fur family transcriptional regulator, peroxide stress response regulator
MNVHNPLTLTTDDLIAHLREAGLRVTPQRLVIYEALVKNKHHPTAQVLFEAIQHALPSLSQATVYNTLQTMVDMGLVRELGTAGDGTVRFDADISPHAHLVCTGCNRIEDFPGMAVSTPDPVVLEQSGYKIHAMGVYYYGLCSDCQRAADDEGVRDDG